MIKVIPAYQTEAGLRFYLVDCGSGLTHLIIFPDRTVMLYDCNLEEGPVQAERGKDAILALFSKVIPYKYTKDGKKGQYIDIFVNSHRDTDHLRGLKYVNEYFPIQTIWDSGQGRRLCLRYIRQFYTKKIAIGLSFRIWKDARLMAAR